MRSIILKDWEVQNLLSERMTQFRVPAKLDEAGRVCLGRKNWHIADVNALRACPWRVNEKLFVKGAWAVHSSNRGSIVSRVEVQVTNIRIDYTRSITEADAMACGARRFDDIPDPCIYKRGPRWSMVDPTNTDFCLHSAKLAYGRAWEARHGEGSWQDATFAWVTDFRLVQL